MEAGDDIHEKTPRQINVLVGCTGSVATIKLPDLLRGLFEHYKSNIEIQINVRVVCTEKALHFVKREDLPTGVEVYTDTIEWQSWQKRGDPVVHIDLAKWADLMVIAPLDANTLAKIANGLCDNLLTCITRAWIFPKPLLFCPAMNTKMWEHPITSSQINQLKQWSFIEVPCIVKTLMCGDTGKGAMAEINSIIKHVHHTLHNIYQ